MPHFEGKAPVTIVGSLYSNLLWEKIFFKELELLSPITAYPLLQQSKGGKLELNIYVTSNKFDAILNILEGLHSSINTIAGPK